MRVWTTAGLFLIGVAACGGGDEDDAAATNVTAVPCGDVGTAVLTGTLDGVSVASTSNTSSFAWVNVGKPSKFEGTWSGGSLHLEWASTVGNGVTTAVGAATLNLDANTKPRVFQSGSLIYDSPRGSTEATLKTDLTFDTGHVTVCIHKK